MMKFSANIWFIITVLIFGATGIYAQSGHSKKDNGSIEGTVLTVAARRTGDSKEPIRPQELHLYENGFEQIIKNFTYDPSPSRIVLLIDNSQTVGADIESLKAAAMEFAYEIFDGDQLFVIGYDEKPEIIQEWTDDAKKLETSLGTLRKQGNPHLFDAVNATVKEVLSPLMPGTRKTTIVVIGDGLDRGSKTPFDSMINELLNQNITVYALQLPDRTGGAYRRNQPKANVVIQEMTEKSGGKAFQISEAKEAAKFICDELHNNRYLLSYFPTNFSSYDARRVFLLGDEGIETRTKTQQPPNVK